MTKKRIDRLLSNLGYGSRKEIAALVEDGLVTLNGMPVKRADVGVTAEDVSSGALLLDGERIDPPEPFTIMLNKPAGYTCSHDENGEVIYDLLPERFRFRKPALSSAGRLDKDSTGQLILTDDGDLLHRIIHPKSHAPKHYAVTLEKDLSGEEAALFAAGTFLMKGDAKPLKPAAWMQKSPREGVMTLTEGRYRQIRRMFETFGNAVVTLHRFQTGGLVLGDLPEGEYRPLSSDEISGIFAKG